MRQVCVLGCLLLALAACSGGTQPTVDAGNPNDAGTDPTNGTSELDVTVPDAGRIYVNLGSLKVVTPSGDPTKSVEWDLAFEGYDVFTNSGVSGSGQGGSFGPVDTVAFLGSTAPDVPFISVDKAGGAFLSWYAYDGSMHALYSRFHVYGVRSSARLWKVQVLSYYGLQDGSPTSALYQLRYAELTGTVGATQMLQVDGTAGGVSAPATAPSGCLSFASGAASMLTTQQLHASADWDICFRRDAISVNSEAGGPGSVGATDLQSTQTATEKLNDVEKETAASELARFDAVTSTSFAGAPFRGDHVVSGFETGRWLDLTTTPPSPADDAWLVVDAGGLHKYLIAFSVFRNATTSSPGTIVMHIKPVDG